MNVKEFCMMKLLTGTAAYKEIAAECCKKISGAKTTHKSVAFYAVELRKEDPRCLDHRKTSTAGKVGTADLIKKYKKK